LGEERAPAAEAGAGAVGVHPLPASEPHAPRPRSNLTLRLITSGVLIPPLLWAIYAGGPIYVVIVMGIAALGTHEFYNFLGAKGARPSRVIGTAAAAALPLVVYVGDPFYATSLMTAVLLGVMILQLARAQIAEVIVSISATFFGVVYVGWLLSHAVSVRFIQADLVRRHGDVAAVAVHPDAGIFFMLLCLVAALGCDVGAYFVGRAYGQRKLAPSISPNKTLEGAIGGVLTGAALTILLKVVFDHLIPGELSVDFGFAAALLFGLAISSVGLLGDLVESILKRDADLKDAGTLLPGVGGVLDRIDSALFAIPVTYYLLLAYYYMRLGL
jgi:phosphatidate cytidylyltransferase